MSKPVGKDIGFPKLDELALQIKNGAQAFLKEEYKWLGYFVAGLAITLLVIFSIQPGIELDDDDAADKTNLDGVRMAGAFLCGALLSASAGWLGMMVATDGNVRTTVACTKGSLNDGLTVAFTTGSIMGFTVVGLGLFGVSVMLLLLKANYIASGTSFGPTLPNNPFGPALQILSGFGFGASAIALFARVAGGIYSKAADVGADLVGKVEAGIDEDDPHNPAVIADNVGDNVGDVAGMGADLFESYVGSLIAAATLAKRDNEIALPFWLSACGVIAAMVGTVAVSTNEKGEGWNSNR